MIVEPAQSQHTNPFKIQYYLDYANLRANYTAAFLDKLANWDYVNSLLE